jgi:hypothetical protein
LDKEAKALKMPANRRVTSTNEQGNPGSRGYFSRPLAPAPLSALVGTSLFCAFLLLAAAGIENDTFASIACFLVLLSGAAMLDVSGRKAAERNPNPLFSPQSLPSEKTKLKPLMVLATLAGLIAYAIATAKPDEWGSPFPYFLAAGFLFLVMPQLLAHRVVRRNSALSGARGTSKSAG